MSRRFDYKKPSPTPQQAEALIERYAKFSNIVDEDNYYLSLDPTRRDKALEDLQRAQPQQIPDGTPFAALFPSTEDSESFIAGVEQEIETLTAKGEAMTFEDRILRGQYAASALIIFQQFQICLAFGEDPAGFRIIVEGQKRGSRWREENALKIQNGSTNAAHVPQASTPPTRASYDPPPSTSHQPVGVTRQPLAQDIEEWLEAPGLLLNMKFNSTAEGDDGGEWYVETVTQSRAGVEFFIMVEGCPDPIPMDVESMRLLLSESVIAS